MPPILSGCLRLSTCVLQRSVADHPLAIAPPRWFLSIVKK
jgi:hypothetical protein